MPAVAVVPAAGRAERFGSQKLIAPIDGIPLLDRTIRSLLDAGIGRVIVVLADPAPFHLVRALTDARVQTAINPDPTRGMFSSIQAGLEAAGGDPILVLPGDMPFVLSSTVDAIRLEAERTGQIVVPVHAGRRGHPLALPANLRREIVEASSASNLGQLIKARSWTRIELPVDDRGVLRDVDVVSDLA